MTLISLIILIVVVSLVVMTMDKQKAKKQKQITVQEQPTTKVETVVVQDPELLSKAGMFMAFIDRLRDEIDQTGCVNEADFDRLWKETKGGL